ncbi:phospholipase D-like domain-containing protein [Anaerosinus sp.]|uniref:phospholipase D-like domain-containing protein n=1 Tax=Selenobaculum sp. TaxID=3074374 RepID=UPI003AB6C136
MRNRDIVITKLATDLLNEKYLLEKIIGKYEIEKIFELEIETISKVNKIFPSLKNEEKIKILLLMIETLNLQKNDNTKVVWSGPKVSGLPGRDTEMLITEMVRAANKNIILTAYAISDYVVELIKLLKLKSEHGVFVDLYVDRFESKTKELKCLIENKSKYLRIFDYCGYKTDKQSLHAKVLVIDDYKTLITSSNLSYNGMDGNLEFGVVIESRDRAQEVRSVFEGLVDKKYFTKVMI